MLKFNNSIVPNKVRIGWHFSSNKHAYRDVYSALKSKFEPLTNWPCLNTFAKTFYFHTNSSCNVNMGRASKSAPVIWMCFQIFVILKLAEYIDILADIIYAKFKIDREKGNWYTACMKIKKCNFFISESDFISVCILLLFYSTRSKLE